MTNITKDNLIQAKELVSLVLQNEKETSKANIKMKEYNFNQEIYPLVTTLSLSTIAFNDNYIMKLISILTSILTYEELRYILINLKNILLTQKKLHLLNKAKYDKLSSMLSIDEIKEIDYLETKGSCK